MPDPHLAKPTGSALRYPAKGKRKVKENNVIIYLSDLDEPATRLATYKMQKWLDEHPERANDIELHRNIWWRAILPAITVKLACRLQARGIDLLPGSRNKERLSTARHRERFSLYLKTAISSSIYRLEEHNQ